ncbi:MAG: PAS domain S-box protein [Proteobacteria bacterium]|nr:PAS domain S-box protein [Pseudomonadota bacterium]MBU1715270.1 PAS domain S-box protein [Pseudomonadota bacterium]
MTLPQTRKYVFSWDLLGDIAEGRPNLGQNARLEVYRLMHFALDHVREAIFLINPEGGFEYVNQEACRIMGYSLNQFLGLGVSDIDPDFPLEQWSAHWQDLKDKGSMIMEGRHRTKAGVEFPVEINANYFEFDGRGYNLSLVRDISERKRAEILLRKQEQEFRTLAENSPDNISRYDREGRFLYLNEKLADFLRINSGEVLGKNRTEIRPDESYSDYFAMMMKAMETDTILEMELEIPDREKEVHLIRFVPEHDEHGRVIGAFAFGRDISDYLQNKRTLRRQQEELAANKAALSVLLDHTRQSETEIQKNVLATLENMVIPYLDEAMEAVTENATASVALQAALDCLRQVTSPYAKKIASPEVGLSPRELQIADLVKQGLTTKDIAGRFNLAVGTVEFYRDRIRKKLKIKNKKANLRTYLLSMQNG